jgi:protein gp37
MGTGINYLDETWSPITGCSGKGCKAHCWAREMVRRFPAIHYDRVGVDGSLIDGSSKGWREIRDFNQVQFHPERLDQPLHWRKPRRIGVVFCGDLFDEQVKHEWVYQVWFTMIEAKQHTYFLLTKQPQNIRTKLSTVAWKLNLEDPFTPSQQHKGLDIMWPTNICLGISITDQDDADRMISELLKVPGQKWVSGEPMLGPINFGHIECQGYADCLMGGPHFPEEIGWVVLGCESGPKRRPCRHEWMIDVVRQCKAAGVEIYCKQIQDEKGKVIHDVDRFPKELQVRDLPC